MAIDLEAMSPADASFAAQIFRIPAERLKPSGNTFAIQAEDRTRPKSQSKPEEEFYVQAIAARHTRLLIDIRYQPKPPFALDGNTEYSPDFELTRPDRTLIYVETKGRRMTSESLTRMKLRQCSERWPDLTWWLARWHPKLPWKVQEVVGGVIRRKPIQVDWLK